MTIDSNTIISVTEASQNFSRATRIADAYGQAVIFKNNKISRSLRKVYNKVSTFSS